MQLLRSFRIRRLENQFIELINRSMQRAVQVRTRNYKTELQRNVKREIQSNTFYVLLDKILTDLILYSVSHADGEMKRLSASVPALRESHILTNETVRMSTELVQSAADAMIRMIEDEKLYYLHPNALADEMLDLWNGERYRAVRFARTVVADVATSTTIHRYRQYGVRYLEFDAEMDDRTTEQCRAMHGTVFDIVHDDIDRYKPPLHHNCRSGLKPIPSTYEGDIDDDMLFDNRDYSDDARAFGLIDKFNQKFRISKLILDKDLEQRMVVERGLGISINVKHARKQTLNQTITEYEEKIKNEPIEHAYIFDKKGNILLHKTGTTNSVSFTVDECSTMAGSILTHNHPGGSSFSPDDIKLACHHGLSEIRAKGSQYIYKIRMKDDSQLHPYLWDMKIETSMVNHSIDVRREFQKAIDDGKMTIEAASADHWHTIWTRVAKDMPEIRYIRRRNKS